MKIMQISHVAKKLRKKMESRVQNAPRFLALCTCGAVILVLCVALFVPPYLGVADDGSYGAVFGDAGLRRMDEKDDSAYFDYYERQYRIETSGAAGPGTTPAALRILVGAAVRLDALITRDNLFDMRFLALLYVLLYIPAIYPVVLFALQRTKLFSEGVIVAALGVLIFGDVGYAARFASLYAQPLEMICLVALVGCALLSIRAQKRIWPLAAYVFAACALLTLNFFGGAAALAFAALCLMMSALRRERLWKGLCVASALVVSLFCVSALARLEGAQTPARQYQAMTRGVLYQSSDPEKTLAAFGIDSRFSLLTDTYSEQNYPVTLVQNPVLYQGFLDRYGTADIAAHYIRNPAKLLNMVDIGVRASFFSRPELGNYEKSAGLPAGARSPFMSVWSTFKAQSAPHTVGFFLMVGLVVLLLYRDGAKPGSKPAQIEGRAVNGAMAALMVFALAQMATVVIYTGDAELVRESFLFGVCMDLMILFAVSEILHRLNIIRAKGK